MAERAVTEGLSVHDIERIAGESPKGRTRKKQRTRRKNKEVKLIEDELTSIIGTKVIINNAGNKGRMEIYYYSEDELNDLIDFMRNLK